MAICQGVELLFGLGPSMKGPNLSPLSKALIRLPSSFTPYLTFSPGTAICQGAVLFGLDPSIIAERTSRKTYGIKCNRPFKKGDPEEKKFLHEDHGCFYVRDAFKVFVRNGDQVEIH